MTKFHDVPWLRIGADSVAIVASILLAFAIDAWWQQRGEQRQATTLVNNLVDDFEASQDELQRALSEHRKNQELSRALLEDVREAEPGSQIAVTMEQVIGPILGPTYSPTTAAIDLAFATGQIDLIENQDLRNALALWRLRLADNAEEELLIREIGNRQLLPALSEQIRYGQFLNEELIADWRVRSSGSNRFDEEVFLEVSSEIEGLLGQRVFLGSFVVEELELLGSVQDEILSLLGASGRN